MERIANRPAAVGLGVLAFAAAVAALVLVGAGPAHSATADCAIGAQAPVTYGGTFTITSASVDCSSAQNVSRIGIVLTMDGTVMSDSERTCHKTASCQTYALVNDPPGDQRWCNTVSARVGPHSLAPVTLCEAEPVP